MAYQRLSIGVLALCVSLLTMDGQSQTPSSNTRETANLNGIILLDSLGGMFAPTSDAALTELAQQGLFFGFPNVRDMELVNDENGQVIGFYRVDGQGFVQYGVLDSATNFTADKNTFLNVSGGTKAVRVADPLSAIFPAGVDAGLAKTSDGLPFFDFDIVRDLEVAPDWRQISNGYSGFILLDGFGGIHTIGSVNLPFYPNASGVDVPRPYPVALLAANVTPGQQAAVVAGAPLSGESPGATPISPYWGFDIARDLEVSVQYTTVTNPAEDKSRTVGMMNGYYILDGYGAVQSCRLPLKFDLNGDGVVTEAEVADPAFGKPINNRPLAAPWQGSAVPYFGFDIARDIELTASGNGFYLLDGFGAVHAVGNAHFAFSNPRTPYFGFDIARDLALVPNKGEDYNGDGIADKVSTGILGYCVLDGFGIVHSAGKASDFGINSQGVDNNFDIFRGIEISPSFQSSTSAVTNTGYAIVKDVDVPGVYSAGDISYKVGTDFVVK